MKFKLMLFANTNKILSIIFLSLLSIVTLDSEILAQPINDAKYFEGRLSHEGRTWNIGIRLEFNGNDTEAALYIASLWRAGVQPDSVAIKNDQIFFTLPFDIGTFSGEFREKSLVGAVTTEDGSTIDLTLQQSRQSKIQTEDIVFQRDDAKIAATLALPPGDGPFPAVVILHGGGDSSRESPPYNFWADYLPKKGIACFIYDKRGTESSTGDWRKVGFDERAGDVITVLEWLRKHKEIDSGKLGLLAVSQGSWVADIITATYPHLLFAVHISGPVVPVVEADTDALISELRRNEWKENEIKERVRLWEMSTNVTRYPSSDDYWVQLQNAIDQVEDKEWFKENPYRPSRDSWFREWYRQVLDFDPLPKLQKTNMPMLWMYGERDSESDLSKNVSILTELRSDLDKPFAIAVFPETGHGMLSPVDAKGNDIYPLNSPAGFFDILNNWINYQILSAGEKPHN